MLSVYNCGIETKLKNLIQQNIESKLFPACAIGAITPSQDLVVCGGTYTYDDLRPINTDSVFDVASLTKVIPTACLALKLIEDGRLEPRENINKYLPEYQSKGDKVTVWNLLTHTVFYEFGFRLSSISHKPAEQILEAILAAPAKTSTSQLTYTNSSSILLGLIVEKMYSRSLAEVGQEIFFKPLSMTRSGFEPLKLADRQAIVPTELHQTRGLIQAEVHDESAFGLRPLTAGTAGLFTTAPDLLRFARMLISGGELDGKKYFQSETIARMAENQLTGKEVTGLGWELDQPRYMGKYAHDTFGKTGFTGCLILCNPKLRSAVVILSNHIHPKRPDSFKPINDFRCSVADLVFGSASSRGVQ